MERRMTCLIGKVAHPAACRPIPQEPDSDASIHLARNLLLSELPGVAFSLITLLYLVTSLIGLM